MSRAAADVDGQNGAKATPLDDSPPAPIRRSSTPFWQILSLAERTSWGGFSARGARLRHQTNGGLPAGARLRPTYRTERLARTWRRWLRQPLRVARPMRDAVGCNCPG
jgi:hypothetical protein